jgi:hypothetical protein
VGSERNKTLRNILIIVVLAVAFWKLPGGGTASNTIWNLLSVAFFGGLLFFGYRMYMEHREALRGLEDRQRGLLYGAFALIAFALVATSRMWNAGGLGGLVWLAMLGAGAWAIYSVWRAYRAY